MKTQQEIANAIIGNARGVSTSVVTPSRAAPESPDPSAVANVGNMLFGELGLRSTPPALTPPPRTENDAPDATEPTEAEKQAVRKRIADVEEAKEIRRQARDIAEVRAMFDRIVAKLPAPDQGKKNKKDKKKGKK